MAETRQPLHPSALRLEAPSGLAELSTRRKVGRLDRIRYCPLAEKSRETLSDHSDDLF